MQTLEKRRDEIVRQLSEAVDIMIESIEAGRAGFDYATKEYADQRENELSQAFREFCQAMKMGESQPIHAPDAIPDLRDERRVALRSLAERLQVPEVTRFTIAMIEAQDQGINVVKALQGQARQLRGTFEG